ncbi:MAG: DUF1045 domain-containing protein [Pseudomonadota bacterium]
MFQRYAVYYTPAPESALAAFGAAWLGWDSATGRAVAHPEASVDIDAVTQTPRKYGFHGTIKPPFRLAKGTKEKMLDDALATLCANAEPVTLAALKLAALGRFLALVPAGDVAALSALAARVVQELDPFRAPLTKDELARRQSGHLSDAQQAMLRRWGYPHVMDQFRFHMTLTGRLDAAAREAVVEALVAPLTQLRLAPYTLSGLTLLGEDRAGRFHQISRHRLGGAIPSRS